MAELNEQEGGHKKGPKKVRAKKSSTHIDMTPMVDLAFLLVTFFMLTTTFAKPKAMEIRIPDKVEDTTNVKIPKVPEWEVLNIILDKDNHVFYYTPSATPEVKTSAYGSKIRKVVLDADARVKKRQMEVGRKKINGVVILIKPTLTSQYKNLVDIMDEMRICEVARYSIAELDKDEIEMLKHVTVMDK